MLILIGLGLVACNGGKKTEKDVFDVNHPKVIQNSQTVDYKTWSGTAARKLDLNDGWDVSAEAPVRTDVVSNCLYNQKNVSESFSMPGHSDLKIYMVLPQEILARGLAPEVQCNFEFILFNEAGSRHIFNVPNIAIVDEGSQPAGLYWQNSFFQKTVDGVSVTTSDLGNILVKFPNTSPANAELYCEDVELSAVPFQEVTDLARFNLRAPPPRTDRPVDILRLTPAQQCRVAIMQNQVRVAVTPSFKLNFPVASLAPVIEALPFRSGKPKDFAAAGLIGSGKSKNLSYSTSRISNEGVGDRRVRIAKAISKVEMFNFWQDEVRPYRLPFYDVTASLTLIPTPGAVVVEEETSYDVTLPQGESVALETTIIPLGFQHCEEMNYEIDPEVPSHKTGIPHWWTLYGVSYELTEKGSFQELSLAGEVVETQTFSWGPQMLLRRSLSSTFTNPMNLTHHEACY